MLQMGDFSTITYSDFDPSENTPSVTGWHRLPYKYPFCLSVLSIIHFLFISASKTGSFWGVYNTKACATL